MVLYRFYKERMSEPMSYFDFKTLQILVEMGRTLGFSQGG